MAWIFLREREFGGGAPEHALRHGFSGYVGTEYGVQGLLRQSEVVHLDGCGGEISGGDTRPERRADLACQHQRLLEVHARLRVCEQAAIYAPENGVSRRLPLAMLDLFGNIQALLHGCQRPPVLSLRPQAERQLEERVRLSRTLPDLTRNA